MKRKDLILIAHIILQIVLFIPIIPFIKYYQQKDIGIIIIILLSIVNFISYVITILNSDKKFILKHSILIILFIIFICAEDTILINLQIGKHIELIIYSLLLLENLALICSTYRLSIKKLIITIILSISALTMNYNYSLSDFIYKYVVILLLMSPSISYILDKKIRHNNKRVILYLQICFIISFCIYKKINSIEIISISEYLLLSILSMESVLLYKIMITDIRKGLELFIKAMRNLFLGYIVLFVMLYLVGISVVDITLLSFYFFIYLAEFRSYKEYKKHQSVTFDELLDSYYVEIYRNREIERLNTLKIQTFLHDDILQIIIAIRRWIEDNLSGSDKNYILQNLDKLNDLIRHEIDSFNPKIKEYSSLYDAYNKLISDLEDMYLSKQMLIEFECKKDIELSSPYDELVYKCINELLINAFKHSKGYNTNINLKVEKNIIYLTVTNVGDYIKDKNKIKEGNIGLNILKLNLKQYRGVFEYEIFKNNEELEESYLQFKIKIPLDRRVVNENFVNRRS